jgi:thiamine-phosphate pyrophosphorylase
LLGPGQLVGVSTHSPAEALAAAREGADYVVFGPVYDTPSKREYGRPQGLPALAEACRQTPVPVLAVGGVTPERVGELRAAGAAGVAVIRGLLEAEDPARATRAFLAAWTVGGA